MQLVFFKDALSHLCKIHRVLSQSKGNTLLVGVGGSGRHSLSYLASFIAGHKIFTIEISKNYRHQEFREDIKNL